MKKTTGVFKELFFSNFLFTDFIKDHYLNKISPFQIILTIITPFNIFVCVGIIGKDEMIKKLKILNTKK